MSTRCFRGGMHGERVETTTIALHYRYVAPTKTTLPNFGAQTLAGKVVYLP